MARGTGYGGEVRVRTSDAVGSGIGAQSWTENMTWTTTFKATYAYGRVILTQANSVAISANITVGKGNHIEVTGNGTHETITNT